MSRSACSSPLTVCEDSSFDPDCTESMQLMSIMVCSRGIVLDWPALFSYHLILQQHDFRLHYIKIIQHIMSVYKVPPEVRDTSIHIFDKFMSTSVLENEALASNDEYLHISAVVSVILSLKMHFMNTRRVMSHYTDFTVEQLEEFERRVLVTLSFKINPTIVPSNFVSHLLELLPANLMPRKAELQQISNQLLELFWEDPDSILFAPSTVAVSAILRSFFILRLDFMPWFLKIPDFCLMKPENPCYDIITNFDADDADACCLFDIDRCQRKFVSYTPRSPLPVKNNNTKAGGSAFVARNASPVSIACSSPVSMMDAEDNDHDNDL